MKKLLLAATISASIAAVVYTSPLQADTSNAVTAIDHAVAQRAAYLDQNFGILLTYQEQQDLKIALIAKQVTTSEALAAGKTSQTLADEASAQYQINDITMQRQLLIEIDTLATFAEGGGGGLRPTCC